MWHSVGPTPDRLAPAHVAFRLGHGNETRPCTAGYIRPRTRPCLRGGGAGPGMGGHVVTPDLALVMRATSGIVDMVLALVLLWYLGLIVPCDTDMALG
jgi:hypothetical protein